MKLSRRDWLRQWRLPLVLGVVGLVLVSGLGYYLYAVHPSDALPPSSSRTPPNDTVVIEGVDLIFSYNGTGNNSSGYLWPSPECDECPFNLTPGAIWTFSFNLTNYATVSHTIAAIDVAAPFVLLVESPRSPARMAANATVSFSLEFEIPTVTGYYFVDGSINAR